MEKTILVAILFFMCFNVFSQTKKTNKKTSKTIQKTSVQSKKPVKKIEKNKDVTHSKFEIGLNTGYDIAKPFKKAEENNNLNAALYVGYFINPKYEIGLRGTKIFFNNSPSMGAGIFGRRYFDKIHVGLGFNRAQFTFDNKDFFDNQFKTYAIINSANLEAGYRFAINDKLKLETGLNTELFLDKSFLISSGGYGARVGIVYGF